MDMIKRNENPLNASSSLAAFSSSSDGAGSDASGRRQAIRVEQRRRRQTGRVSISGAARTGVLMRIHEKAGCDMRYRANERGVRLIRFLPVAIGPLAVCDRRISAWWRRDGLEPRLGLARRCGNALSQLRLRRLASTVNRIDSS